MTLADAIRKGAMQRRQHYGDFYDMGRNATCAVGAAYEGFYGTPALSGHEGYIGGVQEAAPQLMSVPWPMACGVESCLTTQSDVLDMVVHLNDDHEWTRERIADWVQSVEDAAR